MKVKNTYILDRFTSMVLYELENGKWYVKTDGNVYFDERSEFVSEDRAKELLENG